MSFFFMVAQGVPHFLVSRAACIGFRLDALVGIGVDRPFDFGVGLGLRFKY